MLWKTPAPLEGKLALSYAQRTTLARPEASEVLRRRGLPIRLRTLQEWEEGRSAPNPFAAVALTGFLDKHPTVSVKRERSEQAWAERIFRRDVDPYFCRLPSDMEDLPYRSVSNATCNGAAKIAD